jgi:hypothetical protein
VVWQALGADPRLISAASAAERLVQQGRPPHLVWNPLSGDLVQLIPVVRAACSLGAPEGLDCWTSTSKAAPANRQGRLCAQIGVLAWAWEPFTDGPLHGAAALLSWLASWGVPSRWPAGRPAPFTHAQAAARSCARWALGGHFGASQVPGWDAVGPGAIDIGLLSTPATAPCVPINGSRSSRPVHAVHAGRSEVHEGRSEAPTHTLRVALTDMLGPEIDADRAPAPGRLARQRALSGLSGLSGRAEYEALLALTGSGGIGPD